MNTTTLKIKVMSVLLVLAMCLSMLPLSVFAADGDENRDIYIYVGGVGMADGEYLSSETGEISKTQPESGGWAYYDMRLNRLTLHNYTYTGMGGDWSDAGIGVISAAIVQDSPPYGMDWLTIELEGKSSITDTFKPPYEGAGVGVGIVVNGVNLNISGTGRLDINAYWGIYANEADVQFKHYTTSLNDYNSGVLNINAEEYGIHIWRGTEGLIYHGGTVNIDAAEGAAVCAYGINQSGKIYIDPHVSILEPSDYMVDTAIGDLGTFRTILDSEGNVSARLSSCRHRYNYRTVLYSRIAEYCSCGHYALAEMVFVDGLGGGEYAYTGYEITPVIANYPENWVGEKVEVSYLRGNIDAGEKIAQITASPTFGSGATAHLRFEIVPASFTNVNTRAVWMVEPDYVFYTGEAYSPEVIGAIRAYGEYPRKTLTNGTDYTVSWDKSDFTAPGTYTATITGIGNYTGTVKETFEIYKGIPQVPVPQAENAVTYGAKLSEVGLTEGWSWVDGNTVLTVGNTEYTAYYTPIDTVNYDWTRVSGWNASTRRVERTVRVTVDKAPLTVTANDTTITYGDTPVGDGVEYAGFVNNEDQTVLSGSLEYDFDYTQYGDVGTYAITPKGLTSDNYDIAFVKGTLTVAQKEIGISWGATESLPYTGESKVPGATATGLVNGDSCLLTTEVAETSDGAGIIPGRWTARVTALSNANYKLAENDSPVEVTFGIVNGYQDTPAVIGAAETVKGMADGKITGLTTDMEYSTEFTDDDDKYTKGTDPNMTFAAGTYYVRYCAKPYYDPSASAKVVIAEGEKLTAADKTNPPKTGDSTSLWFWFACALISGGAGISLTVYNIKRRKAENSK